MANRFDYILLSNSTEETITYINHNAMALIIGNYISNVKCESFKDPETGRIRVRPLPDQGLPTTLVIECSKHVRERHPIGTKFTTVNVKVCTKPDGRIYLRARDQMIYKL